MAEKKMTKAQVLEKAKANVLDLIKATIEKVGAEEVKNYVYAVPTEVDGNEKWVEITLVAKDTMTDENGDKVPYDPFVVQANYQVEKEIKAEAKAERERKHAEKVKKAEEKRRLAKEKALAKKIATDKAKAQLSGEDNETAE